MLLVVLVLGLAGGTVAISAQEPVSDLSIGGIEHTVVDGQHVIVVMLNNAASEQIDAEGILSIVDAGGLQVVHMSVSTGPLVPEATSAMAIPLPRALPDGRYSLTLMLLDEPDGPPVQYGLRQFIVEDGRGIGQAFDDSDESGGGFPSWLVLAGGLALIGFGMFFRRTGEDRQPTRPLPEVAMIRKVRLQAKPAKRAARIRKILPPDRPDTRQGG